MDRFSFGAGSAFTPPDALLRAVTIAPLTSPDVAGGTVQSAIFRIAPSGGIGRHPATAPQIFAVLDGSGEVSGGDGAFVPLGEGDAVCWTSGEEHEARTTEGMTVLVIEGDGLIPL